jgi:hypothetical protein
MNGGGRIAYPLIHVANLLVLGSLPQRWTSTVDTTVERDSKEVPNTGMERGRVRQDTLGPALPRNAGPAKPTAVVSSLSLDDVDNAG